jgi:hypothetical protein
MRTWQLHELANNNGLALRSNGEQLELVCRLHGDVVTRCEPEDLESTLLPLVAQHQRDNELTGCTD